MLALLALTLLAAPPPNAPAKAPAKAPPPGAVDRMALPGGWLLQIAGDPEHTEVEVVGSGERTLMLTSVSAPDYKKLDVAQATLLDGMGKTVRVQKLGGFHAIDASLSRDGKAAAVAVEPWDDPEGKPLLFYFDEKGATWKKPMTLGPRVLAGGPWIALWYPPYVSAASDADEGTMPKSQVAEPVTLFRADGSPFRPPEPIAGAIARVGDGLAAAGDGKIRLYKPNLSRHAEAALPFKVGMPFAADNGTLIAVGDYTESDLPLRSLLLFDRDLKKTGELKLPAAWGVEAAVAPDGTALLATSATIGRKGPVMASEGAAEISVVMADRTGKQLWKYSTKPRSSTEHFASLSVARGGRRACAGLKAVDDERPDKLVVFDERGKVLYTAEGEFKDAWIDPTGRWLWTVEAAGLSRLDIDKLIAGTAFPADAGEVFPATEDDLREPDEAGDEGGDGAFPPDP